MSACEMGGALTTPHSALPPPGAHSHYTLFPSPQPPLPLEKNWTWGWGGEPARGGPFSVALDGGGTAGVPPPIPPPSKLLTTPNQCLSLLLPLAPLVNSW